MKNLLLGALAGVAVATAAFAIGSVLVVDDSERQIQEAYAARDEMRDQRDELRTQLRKQHELTDHYADTVAFFGEALHHSYNTHVHDSNIKLRFWECMKQMNQPVSTYVEYAERCTSAQDSMIADVRAAEEAKRTKDQKYHKYHMRRCEEIVARSKKLHASPIELPELLPTRRNAFSFAKRAGK